MFPLVATKHLKFLLVYGQVLLPCWVYTRNMGNSKAAVAPMSAGSEAKHDAENPTMAHGDSSPTLRSQKLIHRQRPDFFGDYP